MKLTSLLITAQAFDVKKTDNTCPLYLCDTTHAGSINMDEQVFCYKQDVKNPFEVKMKTCDDG